jgi:chitinase
MKVRPFLALMVLLFLFCASCIPQAAAPPPTGTPTPSSSSPAARPTLSHTPSPTGWCSPPDQLDGNFLVIGYLPDYRQLLPEWGNCLTDLIYFSAEPLPNGGLDSSRLDPDTLQALEGMKKRYGTRLHLSIGGWGRSGNFAPMVGDPQARQAFVSNLLAFCERYSLDGADFDWEFPENQTELEGYIALLKAVKAAFKPRGLSVSVALSSQLDVEASAFSIVDRIQVMSYDHWPRHSTFDQAVQDLGFFLTRGIPKEKLVLGLPFYGREIDDSESSFNYEEIMRQYQPPPEQDEVNGIFLNGIETIQRKTCYAHQMGIAGVMIWELGQDTQDDSSLLRAVYRAVTIGCNP